MDTEHLDTTMPTKSWEFDQEVTDVFDYMLEHSIPSYATMRSLTFDLGRRFVTPRSCIVDLGASLGRAVEPFCDQFLHTAKYALYEISPPMRKALAENPNLNYAEAVLKDESITEVKHFGFDGTDTSLILSILTLQFTPIEYRARILRNVYESLKPGGAFILVEKVLGSTNTLDETMIAAYYAMKSGNGYSKDQIEAKRKSLEGVLVPLQASWNESMLRDAGFNQIECFYRHLNFAGWIAIK